MTEGWRRRLSTSTDHRTKVDEYRPVDDERVLVLVHVVGRGKTSNVDLEQIHATGANVWQVSDGKVTKLTVYLARDRAYADPGLEE
jgi:hypothetical protein